MSKGKKETQRQPTNPDKEYPGSVYKPATCNRWYIEYKGRGMATGLPATEENRKIAIQMLWIMHRRANGLEPAIQYVSPTQNDQHAVLPDDVTPVQRHVKGRKKGKPITPNEAWNEYERYMKVRKLADTTVTAYLDAYLKLRPTELTPDAIEEAVVTFIEAWTGKGGSINSYLTNYTTFLSWCHYRGYLERVPKLSAYRRKGVAKKPAILTGPEWVALYVDLASQAELLDADGKERTEEQRKHARVFLKLVEANYHSGMRIGEALRFDDAWIYDLDGVRAVNIDNKVDSDAEWLPLSDRLEEIIREVRAERGFRWRPKSLMNSSPLMDKEGNIIVDAMSTKLFPWSDASQSNLTRRLNAAMARVGITGKTGWHTLRKTFRHNLKMGGVTLDDSAKIMRHRDTNLTREVYTVYEQAGMASLMNQADKEASLRNDALLREALERRGMRGSLRSNDDSDDTDTDDE